jgi:hypothetical protein
MLGEIDANLGKLKISILLTIKSLVELESNQSPFGLTIERDIYFVQKNFSELKR